MRKKNVSIFVISILLFITGCSQVDTSELVDPHVFYFGEGKKWFTTYTVSKVNNSYFDSLYIQYVTDRTSSGNSQTQKVGPIEYVLDAKVVKLESNSPQELKGVGNLHTATETNAEVFRYDQLPEELTLQIKWSGNSEMVVLRKIEH